MGSQKVMKGKATGRDRPAAKACARKKEAGLAFTPRGFAENAGKLGFRRLKRAGPTLFDAYLARRQAQGRATGTLQRLQQKPGGEQVNIDALSLIRVYDILRRADPDPDESGFIFEHGDRDALRARADELLPGAFKALVDAQVSPEDLGVLQARNVQVRGEDQQLLLRFMRTMQDAGIVTNFDDWLAYTSSQGAESRQDHMNELWEAARRILIEGRGGIDLAEAVIPGSEQTADLTFGGIQVEVKTIREPIRKTANLYGQLQAALGKFANADPGNYEVTLFASIDADLLTDGIDQRRGNNRFHSTADPARLLFRKEIRDQKGKVRRTEEEDVMGTMLETLNRRTYAGTNRVRRVVVVMENAASLECVMGPEGQWEGHWL